MKKHNSGEIEWASIKYNANWEIRFIDKEVIRIWSRERLNHESSKRNHRHPDGSLRQ